MKKSKLLKHLRRYGCVLDRHGARHDIWAAPTGDRRAGVPRHREVKSGMVRTICKQLDVPVPDSVA